MQVKGLVWQKVSEKEWKYRTMEGRDAKEEMDVKEKPGVELFGFQGKR